MPRFMVAVASNSLGKSAAGHTILHKLEVAKSYGFDGCEVAFECLDAHAATFVSLETRAARLHEAARDVHKRASSLCLSLIALDPFGAYDGLKDPDEVDSRLEEAELWCQLCQIMHIPIFQVTLSLSVSEFEPVYLMCVCATTERLPISRSARLSTP